MQNKLVNKFLSNFIKMNENFDESNVKYKCVEPTSNVIAKIAPFYIEPNSMEFYVVVEVKFLEGQYKKVGIPYGLIPITEELPTDKQISIEELFEKLPFKAELLNAGPVGSLFSEPCKSDTHYEFIAMEITPPEFQDEFNKIIYKDENRFIGAISYNDIMGLVSQGMIFDLGFKYLMIELYMIFEEIARSQQQQQMMSENFSENNNNVKLSEISDEVIEKNSQKDFAKIFLNK
jgi:hypothetical protein